MLIVLNPAMTDFPSICVVWTFVSTYSTKCTFRTLLALRNAVLFQVKRHSSTRQRPYYRLGVGGGGGGGDRAILSPCSQSLVTNLPCLYLWSNYTVMYYKLQLQHYTRIFNSLLKLHLTYVLCWNSWKEDLLLFTCLITLCKDVTFPQGH